MSSAGCVAGRGTTWEVGRSPSPGRPVSPSTSGAGQGAAGRVSRDPNSINVSGPAPPRRGSKLSASGERKKYRTTGAMAELVRRAIERSFAVTAIRSPRAERLAFRDRSVHHRAAARSA